MSVQRKAPTDAGSVGELEFELSGQVSPAAVLRLENAAAAALRGGAGRVHVRLGAEARLPTASIAALIAATRRLRDRGVTVAISGDAAYLVDRVLKLAGVDGLLDVLS